MSCIRRALHFSAPRCRVSERVAFKRSADLDDGARSIALNFERQARKTAQGIVVAPLNISDNVERLDATG